MAYKANSIGAFNFIHLEGEVEQRQHATQLIVRPNVDDVQTRVLATQGRPFTLLSTNDVATETAANNLIKQFIALKNDVPQTLVKDDLNYTTTYTEKYRVLDVQPVSIQAALVLAGNVGGSTGVLVRCAWRLIAVPSV